MRCEPLGRENDMVSLTVSDEILNPAATLRFRFHKVGALQYISHLDLVRTLTKVIVRAGLPVWYTEGFNPKPRLSFATPMSVGLESECEFLDLKINRHVNTEAVREAFNRNLTAECAADEVYYPTSKFTEIGYSSYEFRIRTAGDAALLAGQAENLLRNGPCVVLKRSKSGEKETDIRPMIRTARAAGEGEWITVSAVLSANGERFLNPEYIVTLLKEKLGILGGDPLWERYSILRTGTYFEDMTPFR